MTQNDRLTNYLRTHKGGITQREATRELSIGRLSARIEELRRKGIDIRDEYETNVNRYGERTRYKRYWLMEEV